MKTVFRKTISGKTSDHKFELQRMLLLGLGIARETNDYNSSREVEYHLIMPFFIFTYIKIKYKKNERSN